MTQQYCRGDFISWDPKITTFPGLYYLGTLYAWLSHLIFSWMSIPLVRHSLALSLSPPLSTAASQASKCK